MSPPTSRRGRPACATSSSPPANDRVQLRWLFETHQPWLLRLLRLRGVAKQDADDLAADVWIAVARRLPAERDDFATIADDVELRRRTSAWVAEFGRRRAMRHARDLGRRRIAPGALPVTDPPDTRDATEDPEEACAVARAILDAIPDAVHRALLEDLFLRGTTQADAARARRWSEGKLRWVLGEALAAARRIARGRFRDGATATRKQVGRGRAD